MPRLSASRICKRLTSLRREGLFKKTRRAASRVTRFEQLEHRRVLAAAIWHNVSNRLNVNGDSGGFVSPLDALLVINELNGRNISDPLSGVLPKQVESTDGMGYLDVSCDGYVAPIDALLVIDYLNAQGSEEPRGALELGTGLYPALACSPQLQEQTQFATEFVREFTLPNDSTALRISFQTPEFDLESRRSIRDAFEIEVTDFQGNPLSFPYSSGRDAVYNWSEDLEPVFGAGVSTTTEPSGADSTATINLSGLAAGTQVRVTTRLVNNDGDDDTSTLIRGFEFVDALLPAPEGVSASSQSTRELAPLDFSKLQDLSGSFAASYGRTTLAGDNNELVTELLVTNRGNQTVTGRVIVAIDNISELEAAAMRPDGLLADGRPYFDLTQEMDGGQLAPEESLRSREIRFKNDSGNRFTYKLSTYGSLNSAPNGFVSTPLTLIEASKAYKYTANATDPDAQPLVYSIVTGPEAAVIDAATGQLSWLTEAADIGLHNLTIRATDPHGLFIEQSFTIQVLELLQNRPPLFVSDPNTEAIASSGFEISTVATGAQPAGAAVISGFQGPRLVSINAGDQTVGVYTGESNDRFDDTSEYSTGFPTAAGQLFDVGYAVDIGLPAYQYNNESNGVPGMDQGDLNGDGILDFVVMVTYDAPSAGQNDQLVISALLGDGDGGFGSPTEIYRHSIGTNVYDVRNLLLSDVNGDGALDVLAADRVRNRRLISILGHGDGTFDAAVEQTFSKTVSDFRTADIDEDGKLDLIGRTADIGFGASFELMWMKGAGDGTFGEPTIIAAAGGAPGCCYQTKVRPLDLADMNGDGHLDIVIAGSSQRIQIYNNDGAGNFTLAADIDPPGSAFAYDPDWLRVADFTGDGLLDIAYVHVWDSGRLDLLIGDGSGVEFTHQPGPAINNDSDNYAGSDDPVDIDGDGDLDLIFGNAGGDQTSPTVALNDGTGSFSITEYGMVDFSGDIQLFSHADTAKGGMFGDYNRDGVTDFSFFTQGSDFNGVGIRLGTRPGEFGQTRTIPWLPGSRNQEALPGDFNGDGIVDLVDTINTRVFLGVGDGTFQPSFPAVNVSRPSGFGSAADFNLDGLDDFVSTRANTNGSRYYIALANGDGTFTVSDDQLVENSFYGYSSTLITDFNQDGFPDFVAKSGVEGQIDVHLNDPSNPGVFTRTFRVTLPRGSNGINVSNWQESYAAADFTGDGIPDLAFAERDEATDNLMKIVVMAGDGDGDFSRHSELAGFDDAFIAATYGEKYYSTGDFSAGDVDSDGSVDLIAVTNAGARIFINDGTGNFEFLSLLSNPGTQQRGRDSWLVDFDEDGRLDLIQTGTSGYGPLNVRLGNGDGTFQKAQQVGLISGVPGGISRQPFADLDGDGHLDFVYATAGGSDTASIFAGRRDDLVDLLAVDLNGDGNEEILAIQQQMERLQIFAGDNLGGLTRQPDLLTGRAPHAVATVDLDGDGQLELLTANRTGRSLGVFIGSLETDYTSAEFPVGQGPIDVATADVNADGDPDVLVLDDAENALWLFLGDGSTTLGTATAIALGDKPSRFSMADATGDGVVDAVVTLPDTQRLMVLPGDGVGGFGSPLYVDLAAAPSDVAVVDLNDDGNPDLATTLTSLNVLSVLYGRGNDQFSKAQHIQVGESPSRVTLADADEDGRMDFVVANSGDATASVIYNRFDPNEVYRYDADAIDPDDDHLTYAIVDGPGGLIINSETGALLWSASPDQVGVHDVTLSADDGRGGIATQSFKIEVVAARENAAPLIATQPQTTIGAGEAFSYQATALDNDSDAMRYRLIDAPSGATIDPTTGLIQWDGRTDTAVRITQGNIIVPADESLKPESVTVEGWYNFTSLPRFQTLMTDRSYYVGTHETNQSLYVQFNFDDANDKISFFAPVRPVTDRWYHLALTYDAGTGTGTMYVDGEAVGSGTTPNPQPLAVNLTAPTQIVERSSRPTKAVIDNYRIWNVARSAADIQEGMARQYENDPRLVLDLRFGDVQEQTVQDHSMYGNTGFRVSNGLSPQRVDGLTDTGGHSFSVSVEDGRGGYDQQTFTLNVLPELRGSIVGHLFDDLDRDGAQDDGSEEGILAESSLEGWQLYIDTNGNAYPDPSEPQAVTDANGDYRLDGLLPGDYAVRISPVAGYEVPTGAMPVSVTANDETVFDLAIEQLSLSHIRGQLLTGDAEAIAYWKVYADLDGDGTPDENEPMAVTDRNGDYALTGLDAGTYTIRPDLAAGWADRAGRDGLTVNLAADEISTGNDFTLEATNTSVTGGVNFVTRPSTTIEARQTFRYASIAIGISADAIAYDLSLAPEGMTIDPHTGLVAWRPSIDQVGEHLVILRATGASGSIALHDFYLNVTAPNTRPIFSGTGILPVVPIAYSTAYSNVSYTYDIIAQDAESTALSYAFSSAPVAASIDPASGRISWTPAASDVGSHNFSVDVTDAFGDTATVAWTVDVKNETPTILPLDVNLPRASAALTVEYFSRISGTDQLGRPVNWSLSSGPAGLTVEADGTIRWTPASDQLGMHSVELNATTADDASQSITFEIQVAGRPLNAIPSIDSTSITSASLGQTFEYDMLVSDADRDIFTFTLLDSPVGMSVHPSLGTIRWTPEADQLGEHGVLVQVSDPSGATDTQEFTVKVSRFGGPPRISSVPPTEAGVGSAFLYSMEAMDREGDPLSYTLLTAPSGMSIVETTGELSWTPTADQLGQQDVVIQVSDGIGGAATQAFVIRVSDGVPNLPPVITSTSPRFGAVGTPYSYSLAANDPENAAITYTLGRGPAGMSIDAATGLVSWTPTADQTGKHVVTLIATDAGGASAVESFEFDVLAQNSAPVINSTSPADVSAGGVFKYDVLVSDADLDQLAYELTDAPVGAQVDSFGRIRWQTEVSLIGSHDFTVKVSDPRGGEALQRFTLDVIEDVIPPKLSLIENLGEGSRNILPWQGPFRVFAKAIDNVSVASLTLSANGQDIPLDAAGTATFTFEDWTFQTIDATATAIDTNGNVTTKTITFDYDFPEGWSGAGTEDIPTAEIISPSDTASVTGMVSIVGTAAHDDLFGYKLSYRRADETSFTQFHESTAAVTNGELGVWDTSLLLNDEYVIRLEVATNAGVVNVAEHHVGLAGELKLGNFRLSFTDMVIPVAGIPIEITRIYDTLQADREGDFGYGWRLEYRNTDLRVGLPKSGLEDIGIYSALRAGVKVYLNVPGQGRQGFTFNPDIRVLPGFGGQNLVLARPRFTPDPGVTSTLSTGTSSYLQVNEQGELYAPGGIPYNPASPDFGGAYELTTRDGISYRIDGASGKLETATDRNGNEITFSDSAIESQAGTVSIRRDAVGRIIQIIDLEDNAIEYQYNSNGHLHSVRDREGQRTQFNYDSVQRLSVVIDPLGRTGQRQEYDESGRLVRTFDAFGNATDLTFDPNNFLVTTTDVTGNSVVLELDNSGRVVATTDGLGNQARTFYNAAGRINAMTFPDGTSLSFVYDAGGRLVRSTGPLGQSQTATYTAQGFISTRTNAIGDTTHFETDASGNTTAIVLPDGSRSEFEYDTNGNLVVAIDAAGRRSNFEVNANGLTTEVVDRRGVKGGFEFSGNGRQIGSSIEWIDGRTIEQSRRYDRNGNEVGTTDAIGQTTAVQYDAAENVISLTSTGGLQVTQDPRINQPSHRISLAGSVVAEQSFDDAGRVSTNVSPLGSQQEFTYDPVGRVVGRQTEVSNGAVSSRQQVGFEYDSRGNLIAATDELGRTTRYEYDGGGNVTRVVDPLGHSTRYYYDALNRVTRIVDALDRETTFEHDSVDNIIAITRHDGTNVAFEYDSQANLVATVDENGNRTLYSYDPSGLLEQVTDPSGGQTHYQRDSIGNVTQVTDARGNVTRHRYDELSRRLSTTRPLGQNDAVTYTTEGAIATYQDFGGQVDRFQYDPETGRLAEAAFGDAIWTYGFNAASQPTSIVNGASEERSVYDSLGRLLERETFAGQTIRYQYDARGNVTQIEVNEGDLLHRSIQEYDELDRIIRITDSDNRVSEFSYDPVGNLISRRFPSGVVEKFEYDAKDFMIRQTIETPDGTRLQDVLLERDAVGNVRRIDYGDGSAQIFSYDERLQLVEETFVSASGQTTTTRYKYDAVGNRIELDHSLLGVSRYVYNANDQLIRIEGAEEVDYQYDANGRLIEREDADGRIIYGWNDRDRLVSIDAVSQGKNVRFAYNDDGLRVSRDDGTGELLFVYDTNRELPQEFLTTDEDGSFVTGSIYLQDRLLSRKSSESVQFIHQNHIGSSIVTSGIDGDLIESNIFGAFGYSQDFVDDLSPGFAGGTFDSNLTYLRARYYDATSGRFLSPDPFLGTNDDPVSLHRYLYAANSPQLFTDPTGEQTLAETLTTIGIWGGLAALGIAAVQQITGLGQTVDWSGQSITGTYDPLAGKKSGPRIHGGLIGSGRIGAPKGGPGRITTGLGIDYGSNVGGQFNRFTTANGLSQEGDQWNGKYVGISLTLLANVSFGLSQGGAVGLSIGTFNAHLPRFFVKDLRNFQSLGLSGPYLLIDGSFARGPVGGTPASFLQMGLARGDANGPSVQLGNEKSAGVTITGGLTLPLGDSSIFGLFD
ncbi:FG-GAP-like repeat-containing protein [Aureliella helgolandensis]|uniref:tRNA3(Ser)-specific nuclease WapA n=1 Tax=Aureliella helgolandensis TaxID=2527968 RepID=A0A518GAX2_9BACT|nr:FG-GAP-like repeat-containing protein [Aureliella helgolandensis]QDV25752.1 tRNA3(Ser)-specific nuclease WapA precursor [Aureliella helgolandensis]